MKYITLRFLGKGEVAIPLIHSSIEKVIGTRGVTKIAALAHEISC
jgi:hypothetical protein